MGMKRQNEGMLTAVQIAARKNRRMGLIYTLAGGILWGFSGTNSEFLLTHYPIDPFYLSSIRLSFSGLMILLYVFCFKREQMLSFIRTKGNWGRLILYSFLGLLANQISYLYSVKLNNAGTATILQYASPILILIYACIRSKKLPRRREVLAMLLTIGGIFVLSTHGDPRHLILTPKGLFWGLLSAITLSLYNLLPLKLIARWGALLVTGFAMTLSGLAELLVVRPWQNPVPLDSLGWAALAFVTLIGTLFTYVIYLAGVHLIGPVQASLLAAVEPLIAAAFSVFLLGASFGYWEALGFVAILFTIFLLARTPADESTPIPT